MTMAVTAAYRWFLFQLNQLSRTGRPEILLNKDENVYRRYNRQRIICAYNMRKTNMKLINKVLKLHDQPARNTLTPSRHPIKSNQYRDY